MKSFDITISEPAQNDIQDIGRYIRDKLHNFYAAHRLLVDLKTRIIKLSDSPFLYPLVHDEYLSAKGVRFFLVRNYSVFYTVDDDTESIIVHRVLYRNRNWSDILKGAHNLTLIKDEESFI